MNVLLSDGRSGEVEDWYYALGEGERRSYKIDMYTMIFSDLPSPDVHDSLSGFHVVCSNYWSYRLEAILQSDACCTQNRGYNKRAILPVHVRPPRALIPTSIMIR